MTTAFPALSTFVTDTQYCHLRPMRHGASGLRVTCAGAERCLPEYHVARAGFACFALEWVAQGDGTVVLDSRSHALRPGTAFLYGPGVPQVITTHPQKRLKKYFVDFFGKEAAGLLRQLRLRPGEVRWVEEAAVVQTLFDELIREGQRGGAELCDAYLRVLLHKVAKQLPDAQPNRTAAYVSWRRCQEIVETDFHRLRGLRELSERTRLHPSHLCRLYKQFGNRSPHADITRRKLNHAAMLLMTAAAPVKAVALQVGYEDPLHFSRLFRRHFGRSPLAFRRAENRTKPFADASTGST